MLLDILLPGESKLSIDSLEIENTTLVIAVSSTNQNGICPHCQGTSERVHSRYQRQPVDLPLSGYIVRLDITVRRFFCLDDQCQYLTFSERMPAVLEPYARRTNRLTTYLRQVAFVVGGEAGARLLHAVGISVSPDTLLRLIRSTQQLEVKTPRVLGVDDWAKRKGHSYGTILVDLEKKQPVDLLPDRKAASLEAWLKAHPGVEIISRDRSKEYIKGATLGAPDAIQVADRWHLLKNLRENLERWLETKPACLKAAADTSKRSDSEPEKLSPPQAERLEKGSEPTTTEQPPNPKRTRAKEQKLAIRAKRQERYETVKKLHEQGLSKSEIARHLNMDPKTVRKYIKAESCPMYPEGRIRASKLDPYKEYIRKRFKEGCTNATKIFSEICRLGYSGSRSVMMDWVKKELRSSPPSRNESSPDGDCKLNLQPEKVVPWTARRTSWLFNKEEEELSCEDGQALEQMKQTASEVSEAHSLGQRFASMIKEHQSSSLLPWLEDAAKSGIDALKGFAKGIKQDYDAVTNALRFKWSQGQVEGQVNRLKLIKRQMYGRANFDLLRKKVLLTNDVLIEVPP